jgi:RHS repeat-associated protein
VRTGVSGATSETCTSLPFGDGQTCTGTDVSPMHFTGKHWDTESNLDDFGARYYSSGMARWVTPDWSARQEAVPYVDMDNPQSLNLYAYVGNNPTTDTDASGHDRWSQAQQNGGCWFQRTIACAEEGPSSTSNDSNSPSTDSPDKATAQQQNSSVGSELLALGKAAVHQMYENAVNCGGGNVCTGGLPGPAGVAGAAAKVIEGGEAAAELVKLGKSIASEAQMAAKGESIAGAGAQKALKDAGRLASTYGGKAADWAKMTSKAFRAGDGSVISTHWYENVASAIKVEYKSIIDSAPWSK